MTTEVTFCLCCGAPFTRTRIDWSRDYCLRCTTDLTRSK